MEHRWVGDQLCISRQAGALRWGWPAVSRALESSCVQHAVHWHWNGMCGLQSPSSCSLTSCSHRDASGSGSLLNHDAPRVILRVAMRTRSITIAAAGEMSHATTEAQTSARATNTIHRPNPSTSTTHTPVLVAATPSPMSTCAGHMLRLPPGTTLPRLRLTGPVIKMTAAAEEDQFQQRAYGSTRVM
jgi:hypothetical protein